MKISGHVRTESKLRNVSIEFEVSLFSRSDADVTHFSKEHLRLWRGKTEGRTIGHKSSLLESSKSPHVFL